MKKIIFILSLVFYAQPILADILFNDPATCAVDTEGQNTFYICSGGINQGDSCAGRTFRPALGHSRVSAKKGDTFNFNDETYLCNGVVFESLGVSGVLFNNPATCAVKYVKATDVFYICSGTVDTNNPCAGLNYNPDMGDSKIQMTADSMENIGGVNYTCKDGILQKSVSTTVGYLWGDNNWCAVENKLINKKFYLCGDDGSGNDLKCNKKNYTSWLGDNRNFYKNNDEVDIGDKNYTCCIKTGSTGSFKNTTDLVDVPTTVNVDNGTCTYYQKKNVCDNIVDKGTPCTVPTKCNDGYKLVNNKCISISAPAGASASAGASAANNCPTTDTQGIDRDGICQKCTGATPKWDKKQRKCVANSSTSTQQSGSTSSGASSGSTQQSSSGPSEPEIIEITKEDMEKCWFCRKKEAFLECMKSKGNPTNSAYRKDCKLD
ncbi:MAG: hypothetical protein IJN91_02025 [Alphaproteobacteria bacterium]|nr:hypothetical protein [Alphaproteobacteria bacterium]